MIAIRFMEKTLYAMNEQIGEAQNHDIEFLVGRGKQSVLYIRIVLH